MYPAEVIWSDRGPLTSCRTKFAHGEDCSVNVLSSCASSQRGRGSQSGMGVPSAFCLYFFLGFHAARFVSEILLRFICAEGSWVAHVWKQLWGKKIWFSCLGVVEGNGFQGQFTFVNFMCSLSPLCLHLPHFRWRDASSESNGKDRCVGRSQDGF